MVLKGRRPSESWIPVPPVKKGRRGKGRKDAKAPTTDQLALTLTNDTVEQNTLINGLRRDVAIWRSSGYAGVTGVSDKLLRHWADPTRENRILFAQREAAETAIFLTEVAGRRPGFRDWRPGLDLLNGEHNAGLPRVALKMATGTGKTVVMAMLIAWHTLNKVANPSDTRFARRFLGVTPGITIRDRLRVLQPNDPGNYYDERGVVPVDLREQLRKAQVVIMNYHAFLPRDAKEIKGASSVTRKIPLAGEDEDPFARPRRPWSPGCSRVWARPGPAARSPVAWSSSTTRRTTATSTGH